MSAKAWQGDLQHAVICQLQSLWHGIIRAPATAPIPYCHEWFEHFFSECNIKLLGAFDKASFGLSSGFGISMDQQDLWSAQQCGGGVVRWVLP